MQFFVIMGTGEDIYRIVWKRSNDNDDVFWHKKASANKGGLAPRGSKNVKYLIEV